MFFSSCNDQFKEIDINVSNLEEDYDVEYDNDQLSVIIDNDTNNILEFDNMSLFIQYYKDSMNLNEGIKFHFYYSMGRLQKFLIDTFGSEVNLNESPYYNFVVNRIQNIFSVTGYSDTIPSDLNGVFGFGEGGPTMYFDPPGFYESDNFTDAELDFPGQPNLEFLSFPSSNCENTEDYVASIRDLSQSPKSTGGNWDDKMSSFGVDAHPNYIVHIFFFRNANFQTGNCRRILYIIDNIDTWVPRLSRDRFGGLFCANANDKMSSMHIIQFCR